jgi:hypothetical protein
MRLRLISTFASAVLLLGNSATANPTKPITFWVPSGTPLDVTNVKITTIGKLPMKVKLGKSCAGKAGNFQAWDALSIDMRGTQTEQVSVVADGIPANAETLASLRVEGTCTEGGTTWTKYSGVLEVPKAVKAKSTPRPTPKPKESPK